MDGEKIGSRNQDGKTVNLKSLIIGQEPDAIHFKKFDIRQTFKGTLTCHNIWDKVLSPDDVQEIAADCRSAQGNVFSWNELKHYMHGDIRLEYQPLLGRTVYNT